MSSVELKSSMVYFTPDTVKMVITVSEYKGHTKICLMNCSVFIFV